MSFIPTPNTASMPDIFSQVVLENSEAVTEARKGSGDASFEFYVVNVIITRPIAYQCCGLSIKISPRSSISPGLMVNSLRT
jgi:hypothetical protein